MLVVSKNSVYSFSIGSFLKTKSCVGGRNMIPATAIYVY